MAERNETLTARGVVAPARSEVRSMGASLAICFAGFLLPGASHAILGRFGSAVTFAVSILTMFALGLAMHGQLYGAVPEQFLHLFAFVADVGTGAGYAAARVASLGVGDLASPSYEYGTTYLWVAGLLNYLVILDAFDIAQGRKP